MKAESGISYDNAAVASCPKHLLQFAVDQRYDDYTSVDHAVWRFIMRQNIFFLREYAHKVYFQGLLNTGISFERIPRIEEMNDILAKIDWGAVAVDGFIPPAAFMEFQAYKVLVIACDMRQIHHIEYTPAPDIVHEAAGHAPIIVDREYSKYLQRFGEVGAKAMSSKKDFELYEAIRHLSILKEQPNSDPKEVEAATKLEEFASKMAYQVGGLEGINKAIECKNTATCEYSSGLQVSGVFTEVLTDKGKQPIYLRIAGKTALAFKDKELAGHGVDYHKDGFGSPIGKWKQTDLKEGEKTKLEFESGVTVEGKV